VSSDPTLTANLARPIRTICIDNLSATEVAALITDHVSEMRRETPWGRRMPWRSKVSGTLPDTNPR